MNNYKREELVLLAKLYNRCGKHDIMALCIKTIIGLDPHLTPEEERILYEAYKFLITKKRKSLIKLLETEKKEKARKSSHACYIQELIAPAIEEIGSITDDFDAQINILIPKSKTNDQLLFYYRLKCDFIRYKCEFIKGDELKKEIEHYLGVYKKALVVANKYLSKSNLHYLELMLSVCVFYYEILRDKEKAANNAKEILEALKESDELTDEGKQIIDLLKINIEIWSV